MIDASLAHRFAKECIEAWNPHDARSWRIMRDAPQRNILSTATEDERAPLSGSIEFDIAPRRRGGQGLSPSRGPQNLQT